jgi:hypothetical protein
MSTIIEKGNGPFKDQLDFFCKNAPNYQKELGLDATKLANLQASDLFVDFVWQQTDDAEKYFHACVAYKNQVRYGSGDQVLGAVPTPPVYATMPAVVNDNVQGQFADMIQDCAGSASYSTTIGISLGIAKADTVFDPQAGAPVLKVTLAQGGHPLLHTKLGSYEAFQVWRDSNDGNGYQLAGVSLHPDFLDLTVLPAAGTAVSWKYKVIYVYKNQQAGAWSNEVIISVYGNV